jgi:dolichyl-phosphate beta-glucosyltransferase
MLTLVIPVYNYAHKLEDTLSILRAWLKDRSDVKEILFVNDGSTDSTAEMLSKLEKPMRALHLPKNSGKGAAVKAGALAATGDYIFFTDIDMPYELNAIDRALQEFAQGADVVSGSRNLEGSKSNVERSAERKASSVLFSWLANFILLEHVPDTQCGLKGFTRPAAQTIFENIRATGYVFDVEILYIAQHENLRIGFVPVTLINDSNSSVNVVKDGARMAFDLARLYMRTRTRINMKDVLFISGLGLAIAFLLMPTLHNIGILTALSERGVPVLWTLLALPVFMPLFLVAGSLGLSLLPFHKHAAAQFSRYGVIGAFNTALNAAIFNTLIYLSGVSQGPLVTVFALITFAIVITQSFFWNMFWTFRNTPPQNRHKQYARFFAITSVVAMINLSIIHVLVNVVGAPPGIPVKIWANIALLLTIFTAVLGNFFGYKFFVFKK